MNADPALDSSCARGLEDAYEHLRRAAAGSARESATSLQGLGILIGKGMAAWMRVCAAVAPSAARAPAPPSSDAVQVLSTAQRDVVDVLAAMALTITSEVRT